MYNDYRITNEQKTQQESEAWEAYNTAAKQSEFWRHAMYETAKEYMKTLRKTTKPAKAASGLLKATTNMLMEHNAGVPEEEKWPVPEGLHPWQIGELVMKFQKLAYGARLYYLIYHADGPDEGIYTPVRVDAFIDDIIGSFIPETVTDRKELAEDVYRWLRRNGKYYKREREFNLDKLWCIAVNNGILDSRKKVLKPFSPSYIFLEKCRVDYVMGAGGPVMRSLDDGTEQDVDSWLAGTGKGVGLPWLCNSADAVDDYL